MLSRSRARNPLSAHSRHRPLTLPPRITDGKGIEIWAINPSASKRALIDDEPSVLGVTLPRRFESYDEVLAAFESRTASGDDTP